VRTVWRICVPAFLTCATSCSAATTCLSAPKARVESLTRLPVANADHGVTQEDGPRRDPSQPYTVLGAADSRPMRWPPCAAVRLGAQHPPVSCGLGGWRPRLRPRSFHSGAASAAGAPAAVREPADTTSGCRSHGKAAFTDDYWTKSPGRRHRPCVVNMLLDAR